jgi:hypothetical protein
VHIEERRITGEPRNLPNVVRVTSREWRLWLERGPKSGCKKMPSTDTWDPKSGENRQARRARVAIERHLARREASWRTADG